ncbi:MAG: radical SAM protein [Promethearchaeota archaeon]
MELTLRCNGKCPFCSFHSLPESIRGNDLNTEQIKYLISQLAELGVNALTFTGGEPTLRNDLHEIIHYTGVVHDFMNGIATNGYLMPKLLKKHSFNGLDYILTSIDYPTAEDHDRMRGIKVFDKVIEMIEIANKRDIKVIVSTVVMKDNINLLEKICELTERLDCSIELFPCEDIIREFPERICKIINIDKMMPNISQWAKKIKELRTKFNHILTDPFSIQVVELGGFGGAPNYHQKILRCHVAESLLFLSHDGFIKLPCKIHPIISINAFKYPLSKIYNTTEVKEIISKHDTYDFCNNCRLGCAIAASIPTNWKAVYAKYIKGFIDGNLR